LEESRSLIYSVELPLINWTLIAKRMARSLSLDMLMRISTSSQLLGIKPSKSTKMIEMSRRRRAITSCGLRKCVIRKTS